MLAPWPKAYITLSTILLVVGGEHTHSDVDDVNIYGGRPAGILDTGGDLAERVVEFQRGGRGILAP